jgi:hypothetical protein
MSMKSVIGFSVLLMILPALSWSASPAIAGTYSGRAKLNSYTTSGTKTKVKTNMILEIAADDETTLTLGSVVYPGNGALFGDANGFLLFSFMGPFHSVAIQFKNTKAKGTIQGVDGPSDPATTMFNDGKFKLTKTP